MLRRCLSALLGLSIAVPLLSACDPTSVPIPTESEILVNTQTYTWGDPRPAMTAWRLVTAERGWNQADIEAWAPFVEGVMARESGFCPNVLRGAKIVVLEGCVIARQGTHSDAGFAQTIGLWYRGPNALLCRQEGLCSAGAIISTAWNSMTAFVAVVEHSGSNPWCWTPRLRRGAVCRLAP